MELGGRRSVVINLLGRLVDRPASPNFHFTEIVPLPASDVCTAT